VKTNTRGKDVYMVYEPARTFPRYLVTYYLNYEEDYQWKQ